MEHRRIYRAKDKEPIIQALISPGNPIFKEIWRILMFSASVGFSHSKLEPLGAFDSARGIDFQTFGNSPAWPGYLYLISLVERQNATALAGEENSTEQRIVTFEQYANGGLSIIRDRCESHSYSLDSIIGLILDSNAKPEASGNLTDVAI